MHNTKTTMMTTTGLGMPSLNGGYNLDKTNSFSVFNAPKQGLLNSERADSNRFVSMYDMAANNSET